MKEKKKSFETTSKPTNQPTRKEKLYYSTISKPFKIDAWHSLTQNFVKEEEASRNCMPCACACATIIEFLKLLTLF